MYSTPQSYFDAIKGSANFSSYSGDFFPTTFSNHYVSRDLGEFLSGVVIAEHLPMSQVRSGYYTSRPASKAQDRALWARGHAAKMLGVLGGPQSPAARDLDLAVAAVDASVGVHQHHDAVHCLAPPRVPPSPPPLILISSTWIQISGTDLAAVAENYVQMMDNASVKVSAAAASAAMALAGVTPSTSPTTCVEANVSVCPATAPLAQGDSVTVVLFNPLAVIRTEVVSIPVPVAGVVALATNGSEIPSEVHAATASDPDRGFKFTLWVEIALAPLQTQRITLRPQSDRKAVPLTQLPQGSATLVAPGGATATVNGSTGELLAINDVEARTTLNYYTPVVADGKSTGWQSKNPCSSACVTHTLLMAGPHLT